MFASGEGVGALHVLLLVAKASASREPEFVVNEPIFKLASPANSLFGFFANDQMDLLMT